jgi:putative copper export protein
MHGEMIILFVLAALLAWAKLTQSRRVYRALWAVSCLSVFLIGLAGCGAVRKPITFHIPTQPIGVAHGARLPRR